MKPSNENVLVDRAKWIGGSDLPTILEFEGATKYGHTWEKLVLSKLNMSENEFTGNEHTAYGSTMEPIIRDYLNKKYSTEFKEDTRYDYDRGYRANCDGYDGDRLIEIKTYSNYKEFDVEYYLAQCQFYLELFDCEELLLAAYRKPKSFCVDNTDDAYTLDISFDEQRLTVYNVKRDREYFKIMEEKISEFKKYLEKRKEEVGYGK